MAVTTGFGVFQMTRLQQEMSAAIRSSDELGILIRQMRMHIDMSYMTLQRAVAVPEEVAKGDLSQPIQSSTTRDETGALLAALVRMQVGLHGIISEVAQGCAIHRGCFC